MDEAAERTDVRRARAGSYADWAARPHVVTLAFVVMLGIAVLVRLLLTRSFPAPWIMGDELHYSELAKSFASNGVMRLRERALDSAEPLSGTHLTGLAARLASGPPTRSRRSSTSC